MITSSLTLQNHNPDLFDNLVAFLDRYRTVYPDAKLTSAEIYTYHPGAENGANVFCVLDGDGQMRGFAPVFPVPVGDGAAPDDPHQIWTVLLVDPTFDGADQVRQLLFGPLLERTRTLAARFLALPGVAPRPTRLASDLMVSQQAEIAFLEQNGFARFEGMYVMHCSGSAPVAEVPLPSELTLQHWKLSSEPEQQQYLQAFNQAFPADPKTLEALKFLLDSPQWASGGTAITAFHGEELIASILTYPTQDGAYAYTDDVFVLPAWRGRGIAKALIAEGLKYAQAHGFANIILEVKQSNAPAVAVYRAMGYETVNEEVFLGRYL